MKLKIGIDIDEVLADTIRSILEYHNQTYKTNHQFTQMSDYSLSRLWGGTKEQMVRKIRDFYISDHFKKLAPSQEAIKSINLLKEHALNIITARHHHIKDETVKWINSYFPDAFLGIYFGNDERINSGNSRRKSLICKELALDLMLEDHPDCAIECAQEGINVLLFDKPWNQNTQHKKIIRVSSWQEAIQAINSHSQNL